MGEQVTRRDFVKLSSAAGAALGLAATPAHSTVNPPTYSRKTQHVLVGNQAVAQINPMPCGSGGRPP